MITLLLFVALIVIGIIYVLKLEVYFSQQYFITDDSNIKSWFDADEKYFGKGSEDTIIYV